MVRLPRLELLSLRHPVARLSSLRRPRCPLSLLNPSSMRNPITTMTSRRPPAPLLPTTLDPKSLMADTESELFNYTTGRFLYVSYILSRPCLTRNVLYVVPTRPFASESVGVSLTSLDSSRSSPRHFLVALKRLWTSGSWERVASTAPSSSHLKIGRAHV